MFEVYNITNIEWDELVSKLPVKKQDIYFTREYYSMAEANGEGTAILFFYYDNLANYAIYPFLVNKIDTNDYNYQIYDIQSSYGYGGPIANTDDIEFLSNFQKEFNNYCLQEHIIAEFIRFHPLIKNEKIFDENIEISHNRYTVYLDLKNNEELIWKNEISSKNRNMIRKAQKNELVSEVSVNYEAFKNLYYRTMSRLDASNGYYFKDEYFEIMKNSKHFHLLDVLRENKVIASGIFIGYNEYFHYHLSGSLHEELCYAPNNLLLWEAIKFAKNHGYQKLHLGGGIEDKLDDHLFKFKKSFSNSITDFYIGKRIHDKKIYNDLINKWENRNEKKANLFLQYRY